MINKIEEIVKQHTNLDLTARNRMVDELCILFGVSGRFVVCINEAEVWIRHGRKYRLIDKDATEYLIKDDAGDYAWYAKRLFKPA